MFPHIHPVAARLALAHVSLNLFGGGYVAYYAVWLTGRGFSPEAVGILFAAANMLRVFTSPAAGIVADARDDRRSVMLVLTGFCLFFYGLIAFLDASPLLAALAVAGATCHAAIGPLVESATIRLGAIHNFDYGRVRLIGSLAFIGATALTGLLADAFSAEMLMPYFVVVLLLTVGAALLMPGALTQDAAAVSWRDGLNRTLGDAQALLRHPVFLLFLLAASFGQASHAFHYGFLTLTLEGAGYRGGMIGFLWGLGVFAEVILFYFARRVFDRVGAINLLMIGAAGSAVRWAITAFVPPPEILIPLQLLHAASFGAAHLGGMLFILKSTPARLASTGQSLYAITAYGIVMGAASYLSGQLYGAVGPLGFLAMSAMGVLSFVLLLFLRVQWKGGELPLNGR